MQNQRNESTPMTLKIVTPNITPEVIGCDSIHLEVQDGENGQGGGHYGIRPGHANAVLSLKESEIHAFFEEKEVYSAKVDGGFAKIEKNIVTVVSHKILK